jgi:hypothetical protein
MLLDEVYDDAKVKKYRTTGYTNSYTCLSSLSSKLKCSRSMTIDKIFKQETCLTKMYSSSYISWWLRDFVLFQIA